MCSTHAHGPKSIFLIYFNLCLCKTGTLNFKKKTTCVFDTRTWTPNLDKHSDDFHLCKGTPVSRKRQRACSMHAHGPQLETKNCICIYIYIYIYIKKNKKTNPQFQGKGKVCARRAHTDLKKQEQNFAYEKYELSISGKRQLVCTQHTHTDRNRDRVVVRLLFFFFPFFLFFLFLFTPRTPPSHACAFTAVSLCAAHYKFKTNPTQLVHFRRAGKKSIHAQTPESYLTACRLHPNGHSENCAAKADISRHLQAVIAFGSKISRLFEVISLYKLFQSVLMGVIIARGNNSFNVQTNARLFQFDR